MKIGCPKEIKNHEYRVGLTPAAVKGYCEAGHEVYMQKDAGAGSGIADAEYVSAGARVLPTAEEVWESCEMIVKVKEPLPVEYDLLQPDQLVYTYFHFAADERLTRACLEKGIIALAYETVQEADGSLPLLKPMSEIAGRMAPLMGAFYMGRIHGGRGLLPTGVPGVKPGNVLILGGGTVGRNAAHVAAGLGARVTILDINLDTLGRLSDIMPPNVATVFSDSHTIDFHIEDADIVIGAVLVPGAKAPKLITRETLKILKPGCVFVDVAIDQGGCSVTSRPTTHAEPIYVLENIVHYCVANMPGAYARTSTFALNNRTIKYGLKLAGETLEKACARNLALRRGLNLYKGAITFQPVAEAFGLDKFYKPVDEVLG